VLTLSYVDPGQATVAGFGNHLRACGPLFGKLGYFHFLYISNSRAHFTRAGELFSAMVKRPAEGDVLTDALRYFRLRSAWEQKQYGTLTSDDIEWLSEARQRFHGERMDALFRAWDSQKWMSPHCA